MERLGCSAAEDYLDILLGDSTGSEVLTLIDLVATNVTRFFREPFHFDFLCSAVIKASVQGRKRFRLWSAACASGEEPFSLALLLKNRAPRTLIETSILATDISRIALNACKKGVYDNRVLEDVPPLYRGDFLASMEIGPEWIRVKSLLRNMIQSERCNLINLPKDLGRFDAILCRNVLIYFDQATRNRVLYDLVQRLTPGGYLIVGHMESMAASTSGLDLVRPSIYQLPAR